MTDISHVLYTCVRLVAPTSIHIDMPAITAGARNAFIEACMLMFTDNLYNRQVLVTDI